MRTFEHNGQSLHCLTFVSSCTLCGHRWKDEAYEAVNAYHVEQACAVAIKLQHTLRELHKCGHLMEQGASDTQSQ